MDRVNSKAEDLMRSRSWREPRSAFNARLSAGGSARAEEKREQEDQDSSPLETSCPVPVMPAPPCHEPDGIRRGAASEGVS